jgi:hypothetical protein
MKHHLAITDSIPLVILISANIIPYGSCGVVTPVNSSFPEGTGIK